MKIKSTRTVSFLAVGCFLLLLLPAARANDWPQWRGPNRDGIWRETGILEAIPPSGLQVRWRAKVGNGYSGPVVAQGRVFVSDHVFDPELERILCFDEATGKELWMHSYPCDYRDMEYGNGPRAAPTVHDGKVYTLGTQGHLVCLDAGSGRIQWKKHLVADLQGKVPRYGASAAPRVVNDLLIVYSGGQSNASVVALDRTTGALRWSSLSDRPSYSAPIVVQSAGVQQIEAATGNEVWSTREPTSGSFGNVHFTANGERVFLFNHTGHLILARLTREGYRELGRCLLVEPTAGFRAQARLPGRIRLRQPAGVL